MYANKDTAKNTKKQQQQQQNPAGMQSCTPVIPACENLR